MPIFKQNQKHDHNHPADEKDEPISDASILAAALVVAVSGAGGLYIYLRNR